jgi:FtsZ-binding cell division protein ZapB
MDDQLARLEAKVEEAIELIQTLRQEKQELDARCADLQHRLDDTRQERDRLQSQLEEAAQASAEVERYEEKRRLIEQKVNGLLEKLEAMG